MSLIQKILHPTDFSHHAEGAFQMACTLAKDYQAQLVLLHVIPPSSAPLTAEHSDLSQETLKTRYPWPKLCDAKMRAEYRIAEGNSDEEILRLAAASQCDLIVMGTEGRSGLKRFLLGSVAEAVIRKAACPVLVVKSKPSAPVSHAQPGEVVSLRPLEADTGSSATRALILGKDVEVIRMVIHAGKEIPTHQAKGEMILQCLEGRIEVVSLGRTQVLEAGQILYLPKNESHSLKGIEDGSLLVTILLPK